MYGWTTTRLVHYPLLLWLLLEMYVFQAVTTVLHGGQMDGFALPRPIGGCQDNWVDFKVVLRYANISFETDISHEFTIAFDTLDDDTIVYEFCVQNKTVIRNSIDDEVNHWPAGRYCIHSVGRVVKTEKGYDWGLGDCPRGFEPGVTALPFRSSPGQRMSSPSSPLSLTYPNITLFHYCCSTAGDTDTVVDMGMAAPFVLLPYDEAVCQSVYRMESELQYIEWPVAEERWQGAHPYSIGGRKFYYCYYTPYGLGMEPGIVIATFSVAFGTPTLAILVICLCKLRGRLVGKRKHFRRFNSAM